jgi:hypothetical protein
MAQCATPSNPRRGLLRWLRAKATLTALHLPYPRRGLLLTPLWGVRGSAREQSATNALLLRLLPELCLCTPYAHSAFALPQRSSPLWG